MTAMNQTYKQHRGFSQSAGYTLVELLIAVVIAAMLILGIYSVVGGSLRAREHSREQNDLTRQAQFAMQRMVQAVSRTERLLLPLAENPGTAWSESTRDPGVLAVTLDPTIDRDSDGFADADNDKDGRIDEDLGNDNSNDNMPGLIGIDDNNDGNIDVTAGTPNKDNDEDGVDTEDHLNGIDDDGDGSIDEDIQQDNNKDNAPGLSGIDDDGDGLVDEGQNSDDDEDGQSNEDWLDPVVYFLSGTNLMERMPDINPVDGTDYTERVVADNVSSFRTTRIPAAGKRAVVVEISLTLQGVGGNEIGLNTHVRVGSGL